MFYNKYFSLFEYNGRRVKGKIICRIHGEFEKAPVSLWDKRNKYCACPECWIEERRLKEELDFIKNAIILHKYK